MNIEGEEVFFIDEEWAFGHGEFTFFSEEFSIF
jgi:hypothetical protein